MWWKNKLILVSCSFTVLFLSLFSLSKGVKAQSVDTDGFIIQADRVVGSGMTATIVQQETSGSSKKPMLRFHYDSATIYGMQLTKLFNTGNGTISMNLKAKEPVTVKGMTVDTTAISFKGACINAGETVPELGMDDVVMVAHYMDSEDSVINQLELATVSGNEGTAKPGTLQILQNLSMLPLNQMSKEIDKILSGHLPLTCEDPAKTGKGEIGLGPITNPLEPVLGTVTNPLDPILGTVTTPLEPILGTVTKPLDPILGTVTKPLDPILGTVTNPLDPILGTVTKPLDPILETVTKPLDPILGTVTKPLKPILGAVSEPLDPVVGKVAKPLDPIISTVTKRAKPVIEQVTKPLNPVVKKTESAVQSLDPAVKKVDQAVQKTEPVVRKVEHVIQKVDPVVQKVDSVISDNSAEKGTKPTQTPPSEAPKIIPTICDQIQTANGKVTKEQALALIDEAIAKKVELKTICSNNTVINGLQKMQDSLLKSLGLVNLLGKLTIQDPIQQLTKMRDKVEQTKDGTVIFSP